MCSEIKNVACMNLSDKLVSTLAVSSAFTALLILELVTGRPDLSE